ncbi:hypothetical protein [Pedobacter mendelii]|uniref:Right handed beta helix domain-containing protein n=1 Tax=Pedobacter mendelii TaxID=1908240 RepID=A0ABQ2BHC1_9SPHI|nr:hypothetical protein [Pedobacter mendelii]GGI25650.1 hypothetical protein GCM10008119_18730 [Pedobacter mendelii]
MKITPKMPLFIALIVILFAACKKNTTPEEIKSETSVILPITSPIPTTPVAIIPSYEVGTGSGYLTIDGKSLDLSSIKLIKVKGGTYKGIYIKNIIASSSNPVKIVNNGQVNISEGMETDNVSYVTISGDAISSLTYGFAFENIALRAIKLNGLMNGVTLKNMSFKNVNDYCIAGEKTNGSNLAYNGTSNSRVENFKILNCLFDNTGQISFGGNLNENEDTGLFKDVEIANNIFQNTNAGSVCAFTNVQDYNIHNNIVNNINQSTNNHNGVFYMQGNGIFHDNKLTNYQGNAIRMWIYSRGNSPATVEIYNNICYNTRKYGGFEIQQFARNIIVGKTTFVNAKVYNNTVGKMNTSEDWEGQILDLYNFGGTLDYYNNLGFELYKVQGTITDMINYNGNAAKTNISNNKYFAQQSSAVADINKFTSLFVGIGSPGI